MLESVISLFASHPYQALIDSIREGPFKSSSAPYLSRLVSIIQAGPSQRPIDYDWGHSEYNSLVTISLQMAQHCHSKTDSIVFHLFRGIKKI